MLCQCSEHSVLNISLSVLSHLYSGRVSLANLIHELSMVKDHFSLQKTY